MNEVTALLEIYEILTRHCYLSSINHKILLLRHDVYEARSNASPSSKFDRKYAVLLYASLRLAALTTCQNSGMVTFYVYDSIVLLGWLKVVVAWEARTAAAAANTMSRQGLFLLGFIIQTWKNKYEESPHQSNPFALRCLFERGVGLYRAQVVFLRWWGLQMWGLGDADPSHGLII